MGRDALDISTAGFLETGCYQVFARYKHKSCFLSSAVAAFTPWSVDHLSRLHGPLDLVTMVIVNVAPEEVT